MSTFVTFREAVRTQLEGMANKYGKLFVASVDKDKLWDTYLLSFPEGSNPIYLERTEHDCTCCKQFIRNCGNVIAIKDDYTVESIWDNINVPFPYNVVTKELSDLVKTQAIEDIFKVENVRIGVKENTQITDAGSIVWNHFYAVLPNSFLYTGTSIEANQGAYRQLKDVTKRSFDTISSDAINVVLELIDSNSIYRGIEFRDTLSKFKSVYDKYHKLTEYQKEGFAWINNSFPIRNTVIGTLLVDISEGMELEKAVAIFEGKVAPENYKRPQALATPAMIEAAQKQIISLGLQDTLERRFANMSDINVNNVLYIDRGTSSSITGDVFDVLKHEAKTAHKVSKTQDITIDEFIKLLPTFKSVEAMFAGNHKSNLVSLIAPVHINTPNITKWDNNFTWAYNGDLTDAIKERVKAAGGNIDADVRVSLSWNNHDDLDLSVLESNGHIIYYSNKRTVSSSGGMLDVDANAFNLVDNPVENIFYKDKSTMPDGRYRVRVSQFKKRTNSNIGFQLQVEVNGVISNYTYEKGMSTGQTLEVGEFVVNNNEVVFVTSLPCINSMSEKVWNIDTNKFHKVQAISLSPNHWGSTSGNKHYLFFLENCICDESPRGLFNEYLRDDLTVHRKTFEMLGSKLRVAHNDNQLSGLGFSSTKPASLIVRVKGNVERTFKVIF